MTKKLSSSVEQKAIVLSSFFDKHANIGTELRFWLLPVPWSCNDFIRIIFEIVSYCNSNISDMQRELSLGTVDETLANETIQNGTGLLAWIVTKADSPEIISFFQTLKPTDIPFKIWEDLVLKTLDPQRIEFPCAIQLSSRKLKRAQSKLDFISYHVPPDVVFKWESSAENEQSYRELERQLIEHLEKMSE